MLLLPRGKGVGPADERHRRRGKRHVGLPKRHVDDEPEGTRMLLQLVSQGVQEPVITMRPEMSGAQVALLMPIMLGSPLGFAITT